MRIKQIVGWYLNSWWAPTGAYVLFLCLAIASMVGGVRLFPHFIDSLLLLAFVAWLGILWAAIWNTYRKQSAHAGMSFIVFIGGGFCGPVAVAGAALAVMIGGDPIDGFADELAMPSGVEISDPLPIVLEGGTSDSLQQSLVVALTRPATEDSTVHAKVTSLQKLHRSDSDVLHRYLATSPAWRVFEERGEVFATRRWKLPAGWQYSLHGYYGPRHVDRELGWRHWGFQHRLTIGLSGRTWARGGRDASSLPPGSSRSLSLSRGNDLNESRLVVRDGDLVVEVFEQSDGKERRLTKATLAHIEQELAPLAARPDWATTRRLIHRDGIAKGSPSIDLREGMQGGIYDSTIWVNPGEPGMVYLKAFEVTEGTELSARRLKEKSNEWIGWSDDPSEVFLSNSHFTIYEGDWGKHYAARFEVWFVPDSGKGGRKLFERVFKIEGWQR